MTYAEPESSDYSSVPLTESIDEKEFQNLYGQTVPKKNCSQKCESWVRGQCTAEFFKTLFPPITWLPEYKNDLANKIRGDIIAGITVAIVVVPQGLSYAALALLNPVVGFYTTIFPSFVYMLLGTSHECHLGPFALVSLLTADGISAAVPPIDEVANTSAPISIAGMEFEDYNAASTNAATVMALFVGVFQICFGLFGIGNIVTAVIADPFVSGFTTGAAFLIAASQLSSLFGVYNYRSSVVFVSLYNITGSVVQGQANWASFIVGSICFIVLFVFRHINKTVLAGKIPIPGELIVVILACLASYFGDFEEAYDMQVVGEVPSGLPAPAVPRMNSELIGLLIGPSLTISVIAYIVSISVSKLFADKNNYEINGTQELMAMGIANTVGCFFSCYPAAASLSRTAVVDTAGGKTQLHNLFSVTIILIVLYGLSFLLYPLPKATLSAVVFVALVGLFLGFKQLRTSFVLKWQDGVIWLGTFLATLSGGVTVGIGVGVGFSLLLVIHRASRPYNAILGRIPGTMTYRSVRRYTTVQVEKVKIFRFDASLNFVNRAYFEECVLKVATGKHVHSKVDNGAVPEIIIIQCTSINGIDTSALKTITKLVKLLKKRNILLLLCSAKWDIRNLLARAAREQRRQVLLARKAAERDQCCRKDAKEKDEDREQLEDLLEIGAASSDDKSSSGTRRRHSSFSDSDDNGEVDDVALGDDADGSADNKSPRAHSEAKADFVEIEMTASDRNAAASSAQTAVHDSHRERKVSDGDVSQSDADDTLPEHTDASDGEDQELEFEDDAFAIIKSQHIFPNLVNALRYVRKKYGYVFEKPLEKDNELGHLSEDDEDYEEGNEESDRYNNSPRASLASTKTKQTKRHNDIGQKKAK